MHSASSRDNGLGTHEMLIPIAKKGLLDLLRCQLPVIPDLAGHVSYLR